MGASTAAGTKLSIGTTATDGTTDTYVVVGELVSIPEFGRTYNEVTYNPLSTRGTKKFKGSFNDGTVAVQLGKDSSDAGQAAMLAALDTDFDYNFKVELNDKIPPVAATVTISIATPGVVTDTAHGLADGTAVKFTTTGALPTGLTAGTTYYVLGIDDDSYSVSATKGGSAITTSGSGSGVDTRTTVPTNTTMIMKAKVMSYTTNVSTIDNVVMSTGTLSIQSGSLVETARLPAPTA
jgi:hypothetical protein